MPRPPGPWLRAEYFFSGEEKEWSSILWFIPSAAIPLATIDFNNLGVELELHLMTTFELMLANTVAMRGIYMIANDGTSSLGFDFYNPHFGVNTNPVMPEDVAMVVQLITATPGPSGRGRVYLSGLAKDMTNGSYLSATGDSIGDGLAAALKGNVAIGGDHYTPAVASPTTSAIHPVIITNAVKLLGTNRKRKTRF